MIDHELRVETELTTDRWTVRVCPCECAPGCQTRLLLVSEVGMVNVFGRPAPLWLSVGVTDAAKVGAALADLTSGQHDFTLHKGLLMHGALWEKVGWRVAATRQAEAYASVPAGIDHVSDTLILRTRFITLGDDFTRVARALEAVASWYGPGGTVEAGGREAAHRVKTSAPMRMEPEPGCWS